MEYVLFPRVPVIFAKMYVWSILAPMLRSRMYASAILLCGLLVGYGMFFYEPIAGRFPFVLGLDLAGGTQLVYQADVSSLVAGDVSDSMTALRDVIERRVNLFGVSEPLVQVEKNSFLAAERQERLIVELPGITDVEKAVAMIGETPLLEFKLLRPEASKLSKEQIASSTPNDLFISTGLTGAYLKRASLQFVQNGVSEATVSLEFNKEGADLFAKITREHKGEVLAIFLDGQPISTPVIRDEIVSGTAVISGGFTPIEARELARELNFGALPVPIKLIATQSIDASLGLAALKDGMMAGVWGLTLVVFFLVLWYRLPGFLAAFSLALYSILMLVLFKLIPVTITAAGIAGFVLSIGMAVDANILIFERMKEERKKGKSLDEAMSAGFARAWFSIRDANISSTITAVILFWFGTPMVKGFALTLGIGVFISMLTAIVISRTFLLAVRPKGNGGRVAQFLFGSGIKL